MVEDLITQLNRVPLAGLMLVVAIGFVLGRLRWRGVSVGPAGGTLVVALLFGHLGLTLEGLYGGEPPPVTIGSFGFALFIYSVGFEAGPRFFSSLRGKEGWRYVAVGVGINLLAVAVAVVLARIFEISSSSAAGLLAGALTSAPAYAAASEVASDATRLSVSFAIAYPIGLVGLVVLMQVLPRLVGERMPEGDASPGEPQRPARLVPQHGSPELTRAFEVTREDVCGRSLRELDLTHATGCVVSRLRRESWFEIPTAETELAPGDHLLVTGRVDELRRFEELVGPEVYDRRLAEELPERRIQVTRSGASAKTLQELALTSRFHVVVKGIESGETLIEPTAEATLHVGDVVIAAGSPEALATAAEELGRFEPAETQTDIAIYAAGICLGVLIGSLHFDIGFDFSLGLAGGLLLVGVALGRFRQIGPFSANVPAPARQLVRDLGILLFVAEAGLSAGARLTEVGAEGLGAVIWTSLAVVAIPVVLFALVSRFLLGLDRVQTWGSTAGGMTSSAALTLVKRIVGNNEPAVSYAAAYAVASVLVTISGQIVVLLT